jgi:hypothetical protein
MIGVCIQDEDKYFSVQLSNVDLISSDEADANLAFL